MLFQEDLQRNVLRVLRRIENFLGLPCHDFTQGVADVEVVPATVATIHAAVAVANDTITVKIMANGNSNNSSSSSSKDPPSASGTADSAATLVVLVHHRHSGHGKTAAQAGWWLLMTTQAVVKALVNGVLGLLGDAKEAKALPTAASSSPPPVSLTDASFNGMSVSGPGGPGPGRSGSSSRHSARLQQQVLGDTLTLIPANTKPKETQASPTLRTLLVALYQDHNRRLLEYTTNLPRGWIGT